MTRSFTAEESAALVALARRLEDELESSSDPALTIGRWRGPRCPAHLLVEPCPTCAAYIAAGL